MTLQEYLSTRPKEVHPILTELWNSFIEVIEATTQHERERCAKFALECVMPFVTASATDSYIVQQTRKYIAEAIERGIDLYKHFEEKK